MSLPTCSNDLGYYTRGYYGGCRTTGAATLAAMVQPATPELKSAICGEYECNNFFSFYVYNSNANCLVNDPTMAGDGVAPYPLTRAYALQVIALCPEWELVTPPSPATPTPTTLTPTTTKPTTTKPTTTSPTPTNSTSTETPTNSTSTETPTNSTSTETPTNMTTTTAPPTLTSVPATATTSGSTASNNSNSTPSPAIPNENDAVKSSGANNTAVFVGAGVGAVLIVAILWFLFRFRRKRSKDDTNESNKADYSTHIALATPAITTEPFGSNNNSSQWWNDATMMATIRIPLEAIHVGERISQGGFGEVFRGVFNGHDVAIKKLLSTKRKDQTSIHQFMDEIQLTASLDHASIVQFVGVAWDSLVNLCTVTEFMAGGDLRSLLTQYMSHDAPNGFDTYKLEIAIQVANALVYLHSRQPVVVHRDLKSRNILLTQDGVAKVMDFGVSRKWQQDTNTMTAGVGSSLWMAPEVMMGDRYNEKADIFSFGIVLSELDTHELPYEHAIDEMQSDQSQYSSQMMQQGAAIPEMVLLQKISMGMLTARFTEAADPEIVALARDCLELDPETRPSADEVVRRIHNCVRRRQGADNSESTGRDHRRGEGSLI